MTQTIRSPCTCALTHQVLQESVQERAEHDLSLREVRVPERANLRVHKEARGDTTVTLIDVTVATAGKVNRNNRLYPRAVWKAAVAAAQPMLAAGELWGLLEHPEDWYDPLKGRLAAICIKYETLTMDGDVVSATGVLVETAAGQDLKALLESGIAVGISSNGTGSARYLPASEVAPDYPDPSAYIGVIQDDFRLLTIDAVSDPADLSGSARKKEHLRGKPPPLPKEASHMNKHLKVLLDKYQGRTLEQIKVDHPSEYTETLELIARESVNPIPAPVEPGNVSLADYRALENTVVELRGTVGNLTTQNHNATRDGIALTALESARLPSAGTVKNGESEIDLDASFRAELTGLARTAESDEAARTAVASKITERRGLLEKRTTEGKKPGVNGVNLPLGDNSRSKTDAERQQAGDTSTRQLEQVRSRNGLLY
ncbi:hypothetical protein GCM10022631_01810 [Deinococcus rubellus]|uniref:Uncharacterized protein n=1 Tax=Deinococcus rubellus TaxID=1889240 RepID=A0ABY5YK89_9DEIO|nr:hypothetical protein [Deinococcus rubellus]UWX64762.1 hypothetical protein N0D28_03625 [Deinococcus rubellus]